jgi:hypothetical protein
MAATWEERVFHGAGPTESAWTANGKFHKADTDPTTDVSATAVVRPAAGTNYSWRKSLKSKWSTTPAGKIMNLRTFSSGAAPATGVDILAKKSTTYTEATSADETTPLSSSASITTYTSGSPLVINSGDVLVNPSTGLGTQDYLELQMAVGTSAEPGIWSGYTITRRYDES